MVQVQELTKRKEHPLDDDSNLKMLPQDLSQPPQDLSQPRHDVCIFLSSSFYLPLPSWKWVPRGIPSLPPFMNPLFRTDVSTHLKYLQV